MQPKPDGEIQDDSDDRGGDGRQGRPDQFIVTQPFDVRCTEENPEEAGDERDPRRDG